MQISIQIKPFTALFIIITQLLLNIIGATPSYHNMAGVCLCLYDSQAYSIYS